MRVRLTPTAQSIYAGGFAAIALGTFGYVMASAAMDEPAPVPSFRTDTYEPRPIALPPCEYEDSPACVWDASVRGNGIGQSFYADFDGEIHPIMDGQAAYLLSTGAIVLECETGVTNPPDCFHMETP